MKSIYEIINILNYRGYLRFVPDEVWIRYRYKQVFKKKLDLHHPQTFNEKMPYHILQIVYILKKDMGGI